MAPHALEPLPPWWPRDAAYHGTDLRAFKSIQKKGLCAPVAEASSFDEYGWVQVWADETMDAYRRLTRAQQRRLHAALGLAAGTKMTREILGASVALFWVTFERHVAEGSEVLTEVNLALLDYYWWFRDDVRGESSFVFVLPRACPQAPGSILRRV